MQHIIARVKNKRQLSIVSSFPQISMVIADYGCAQMDVQAWKTEFPEKEIFLQLPDVLREKKSESVRGIAERAAFFDGVVLKNLDEIGLWKTLCAEAENGASLMEKRVIGDSFLYAYNTEALSFYRAQFPGMQFLLSDELSDEEALALIRAAKEQQIADDTDFIYKAYGYQPLMITNQCMNRNYAGCTKPKMAFADEKRRRFFITSECGQCYDIVYNGLPTSMLDQVAVLPFSNLLLDFTLEEEGEVSQILSGFFGADSGRAERFPEKRTRGHHEKGIA